MGLVTSPKDEELEVASSLTKTEEWTEENEAQASFDQGLTAWLQVLGSFLIFFNTWGTINSFGAYQTYYQTVFLPDDSPSTIAWIGSVQAFLLSSVGVLTGPLFDAGYARQLLAAGAALLPLGMMMASVSTRWWQLLLSQAVCVGLGAGCMHIPSVAIIPQYFARRRRALAIGIGTSGSALGGVVFPLVFGRLVVRVGFAWAARAVGFVNLATALAALALMRVRTPPRSRRVMLEPAAFREPPYAVFCAACFVSSLGFSGPKVFVQPYAVETTDLSPDVVFYLLPIINSASVVGRLMPALFTGGSEPMGVLVPAAAISGILSLAWIGIRSAPGLVAFAVLYGLFSGAFVSLPSVALAALTKDMSRLGTRMGMNGVIQSFAALVGNPIAGALLASSGSYLGVQIFSGLTMFLAGVLLFVVRTLQHTARTSDK